MDKKYLENFNKVLLDANKKYNEKLAIYGESWKTMPIEELILRFWEEIKELENTNDDVKGELIDIINIALMYSVRVRESENKNDKRK